MSRVTRAAQVPTRLAGSSLEACAPRAKSQLPRLADAPLSPGTRRAPPRKGRAQFDNPDSSVQNTIYASENARFETQQTITNGGRAKVAGASRLQTRETAPSSHRPRALTRAFRAKRLGSRATRLGKHARPTTPSPSTSSRLPVPAPTSRARPEPASRPHPHPSLGRVSSSPKNERKKKPTDQPHERKTKTETDTQATASASRRPPLPPTRMRRRGRSPTHPACRRTRTPSSTWGARRWAPADSTRRSPGSTTKPRKPSPRR
jgi:hypothetical protein